jgi:hypothetical protein
VVSSQVVWIAEQRGIRRLLLDAIRNAGETGTIHFDAREFRLVTDIERRFFNLGNIYREYCATPRAKRSRALRHYIRSWFANRKEIPANFDEARPDLLPAVRGRSYFEMSHLQARIDALPPLHWPHQVIAEHLVATLVYMLPEAMMQVQQRQLTEWERSFPETFDVACRNLREISRQPWKSPSPGVWVAPWHDDHNASRLLLLDLLPTHAIKGDCVAMVPNRDTLLVTGSEDEEGLSRMAELAEKELENVRPIGGHAFHLSDRVWQPWLPDAGHPLHERFKLLQLRTLGRDYAAQKDLLDALHERTGEQIWVATYSAVRDDKTGLSHSYCVWSQGVDTLLPVADRVHFFVAESEDGGSVVATANWDRVQQVVGHLMEAQDLYPPRYRAKKFATSEELAELGKRH